MHGELAQLIALAAHGSAFMTGPLDAPAPELFPESTVFRFTNSVEFWRRRYRLAVVPGMGSWNDVTLVDDASYKTITRELFEAVMDAVLAAANSHGPRSR